MSNEELKPRLDIAAIQHIRELEAANGTDLLTRMLDHFREQASSLIGALYQGCSQGDISTIEFAAHRLKSSSVNLGAVRLSCLCGELYKMARSGFLSGAKELVRRIEEEYVLLLGELNCYACCQGGQ